MGERKEPGMDFNLDVVDDASPHRERDMGGLQAPSASASVKSVPVENERFTAQSAFSSNANKLLLMGGAVLVVFVLMVGFSLKKIMDEQHRINNELNVAIENIDAIGGALNTQGETILSKGGQTQDKLKFLDIEMRKLWALANERNKKWIQELQGKVKALETSNKVLEKELAVANGTLAKANLGDLAKIRANQKELQTSMAALDESMVDINNLLEANGETMVQLDALVKPFVDEDIAGKIATFSSQFDDLNKRMTSVDAHRRQVNRLLEQLDTEVRALKAKP